MIRNYIVVAIRNITRNKFFSIINIFGLAVAMSICMTIIMLVADQMMYDRYNTDRDQIYRVISYGVDQNGRPRSSVDMATSPMTIKNEFLDNYTGVTRAVRLKRGFGNGWLELENQNVNIPVKGFWADPGVIEFFQYEMELGDAATALEKPYSVVITRQAANKLFKDPNPIGKTITVGSLGTYTVMGVLKDTQKKSHIVFEALASMETLKSLQRSAELEDWMSFWDGWTYIQVADGYKLADIQGHLDQMFEHHIGSVANPDAYKAKFKLQSLNDITPGPLMNNPIGPSLPWVFVYFLGGLAIVIMITSCFNFTNLSIARSLKRAKEIGVRKVTGAARWQIIFQFLSESVVVALLSLVAAFGLIILLKPLILQLTFAKIFMWDLELNMGVVAVIFGFAVFVGLLSGFFPAIVLSAFQPVKVLKSVSTMKLFSKVGLRKVLLVGQFTISLIFIVTVIVMYNQLQLFLTKDYGFNMKGNVMVRLNNTNALALKNELLKQNNISSVTAVSHIPAANVSYGSSFKKDLSEKEWTNVHHFSVDEDYMNNMEVELAAGKFFEAANETSNKNFIVINERALKTFHYKTAFDALGQELILQADSSRKQIIGVVKDYNHIALMSEIEPMALMFNPNEYGALQVRFTGTYQDAAATIEKSWAAVNPGLKVDMKLIEEEIKFFYNTVFGDIVDILGFVSGLAIMISCLGLLGMATYSIETRLKEISIRKVLGSTDKGLVMLLSKGFLKLLIVAVIIGLPAAWFINNLWLDFMAYHTNIGVGTIMLSIAILFALGGITIGSQTLRAAFANPADNLKNE